MVAAASAVVAPSMVMAAEAPKGPNAFSIDAAIKAITGGKPVVVSPKVHLKAPEITENGAVVPVKVDARKVSGVTAIAILAEKNPTPLIANFKLGKSTQAFVSTRIKMGKTSNVIAVVTASSGVTSARKEVKVTIGGCGG